VACQLCRHPGAILPPAAALPAHPARIEEVPTAVAKRTRGSRRDRRRGVRPTTLAPAVRPSQAPFGQVGVSDEAAVSQAASPARTPLGTSTAAPATRQSSRLAAAAGEYRYVTLDLRRIVAVIGTLLIAMLALWVAIDVLRVISL
jgi:hypothetical protein